MRSDEDGDFWLKALIGAVKGIVEQIVSDVVEYITTGECESTFSDYIGAAAGGAAEAVVHGAGGKALGAAVDTTVKMTCDNIYYSITGEGKHYSTSEILHNVAFDATTAYASSNIMDSVKIRCNVFDASEKKFNNEVINRAVEEGLKQSTDRIKKPIFDFLAINYNW